MDFLKYDISFRLNKFIERLEASGEASGNYGSHIGSPISSLQLYIGKAPNGKSILQIIPNLDNEEGYEARIIELLNDPAMKNHLEPHFSNRGYKRIQQSASIKVIGNEEELNRTTKVLQARMGFRHVLDGIRDGGYWVPKIQNFTLPSSEVEKKALAVPYKVEINISNVLDWITISFIHPESYRHTYYEGLHLNHARDTFKKSLEECLQK